MKPTLPDRGWAWIVLVALFFENCLAGFCMYAVGLFHIIILERFESSVTVTSWLSSSFLCLLSLSGPLASYLIDKWNCRVTMMLGCVLLTIGLIVTAFSTHIVMVLLFLGLMSGVGIGLTFNAGYIALVFNFERKRSIATGIAVSGCGIGPFIFSPLYQKIHEEYGYNGFFLMVAGLALQTCVVAATLRPSYLENSTKLARQKHRQQDNPSRTWDFTVVKNISVSCVGLGGCLFNIGIFIIYLHFPKYVMENGSDEAEVAWYLSLSGIFSCVGRLLLGLATNHDSVNEDLMYFGSYVLIGAVTVCLPLLITYHSARITYVVLLGLYSGTCYVVANSILFKLLGPNHVSQATGYVMAYIGIGTLIGPPLGGFIVDNGGTYDISFVVAGLSLILGGCLELSNVMFRNEYFDKPFTEDVDIDIVDESKTFREDVDIDIVNESKSLNRDSEITGCQVQLMESNES